MRSVKIGNKNYTLKLSYNAQKAWQESNGQDFQDIGESMPLESCISLIYYGLKAGSIIDGTDLDLDEPKLGEMLDTGEIMAFTQYLIGDISKSINDASESLKKNTILQKKKN